MVHQNLELRILQQDVYFDDESAEVVISSLRLGDDHESGSLFTNSNWFAFEDDRMINERTNGAVAPPPANTGETGAIDGGGDGKVIVDEDDELADTGTSEVPKQLSSLSNRSLDNLSKDLRETGATEIEKPPEWVEWRESSDSVASTGATPGSASNADSTVPSKAIPDSVKLSGANADSVELSGASLDSVELSGATLDSVEPSNAPTDIVELSNASANFGEPSTAHRPPVLPNGESRAESDSHADDVKAQ